MIKFFYSLLPKTINWPAGSSSNSKEIVNRKAEINLLQIYRKIFTTAVNLGNQTNEIAKANLAIFEICKRLYNMPNNLITVYDLLFNDDLNQLQWKQLSNLLSANNSTKILMIIAAHYVFIKKYAKALEIYCFLQNKIQTPETFKSAVNYGILKLFQFCIPTDKKYRTNIEAIDIHSSNILTFDRILLCRLIIWFWVEMEDKASTIKFNKELIKLQNTTWSVDDLETHCIGHILTKVEDNALACLYWEEIQAIYNEMLPKSIVTLLYSSDSTFEQIFRATKQMNNDLFYNITCLAEDYKLLATYDNNKGFKKDAEEELKTSKVISSKIHSANKEFTLL
jgi:hypothetical protein